MNQNFRQSFPRKSGEPNLRALRFDFRYSREGIQLLKTEPLKKLLPPSDPTPKDKERSGYWIELQDRTGDLLYRRALSSPFQFDLELHGDKPGAPMQRFPWPDAKGGFTVFLPDLEKANLLLFYGTPLWPGVADHKATVLLSAIRDDYTGNWSGEYHDRK